ncbi:MAG: AraC family transcriptional regulator [Arenicellales bacterium]|nr:AraC family transcriptional regulator [Arenicellales bacterium]
MPELTDKLAQLAALIEKNVPGNGLHRTPLKHLRLFRESRSRDLESVTYEPALIIAASGSKHLYLEGVRYQVNAGTLFALFMPMVMKCEMFDVDENNPMLAVGIVLDRYRLAKLLHRIDNVDYGQVSREEVRTSGIFSAPTNSRLLDAVIRLLKTLDDPAETAVIGEAIIDEIYFRILTEEQGGSLRVSLRQQGQIQQISRVVEYLHENLAKNLSVEELASMVNMSPSGFHKKFKEVMHLSPLQYTKLIRLNTAHTYLLEGMNVSEAGYLVGYNSPAQFSREYKRQFGETPSAISRPRESSYVTGSPGYSP